MENENDWSIYIMVIKDADEKLDDGRMYRCEMNIEKIVKVRERKLEKNLWKIEVNGDDVTVMSCYLHLGRGRQRDIFNVLTYDPIYLNNGLRTVDLPHFPLRMEKASDFSIYIFIFIASFYILLTFTQTLHQLISSRWCSRVW